MTWCESVLCLGHIRQPRKENTMKIRQEQISTILTMVEFMLLSASVGIFPYSPLYKTSEYGSQAIACKDYLNCDEIMLVHRLYNHYFWFIAFEQMTIQEAVWIDATKRINRMFLVFAS